MTDHIQNPFFVLAAGILVSSLLFVSLSQVMILLGLNSDIAIVLFLIIGFLCGGQSDDNALSAEWQYLIAATVILCRGLQGAWWSLIIGCFAICLIVYRRRQPWQLGIAMRRGLFMVGVLALVVAIVARDLQDWWWFPTSNDASYFESLSTTLVRFGPNEHPGLLGGSVMGYHWFAYGWVGAISSAVNSPPWVGLTIYAPILALVTGVSLIFAIVMEYSTSNKRTTAVAASLALLVPSSTFLVSTWFGNLWILATVLLFMLVVKGSLLSPPILLTFLLTIGSVYSKSTNVVLILVLGGVSAAILVNRRRFGVALKIFVPTLLSTILGYLYFTSGVGPRFIRRDSLICASSGWPSCVRSSLTGNTTPSVVALLLLLLGVEIHRRDSRNILKILSLGIGSFLFAALISLSESDFKYYIASSLSLVGLVVILIIGVEAFSERDSPIRQRNACVIALTALMLGSITAVARFGLHALNVEHRSFGAGFLGIGTAPVRLMLEFSPQGLFLAVLVVVLFWLVGSHRHDLLKLTMLVPVGVLSFLFGQSVADSNLRYLLGARSFIESTNNSAPMATHDLAIVAELVRMMTPKSYVIATNNFCCRGADWLQDQLESMKRNPRLKTESWDDKFGGANYLVPSLTQRRTLASGIKFLPVTELAPVTAARLQTTLEFANSPTNESMVRLCRLGADGALINLSLTAFRSWNGPGVVRASAGDFVFVDFQGCLLRSTR